LTKVFISYRRDDSAYIAATLFEKLQNHFGGDSVFFDIDTIPLGTDFRKLISNSVQQCDVLLAVIGDSWVHATDEQGKKRLDDPADFVRLEIESALTREIPVIPVLVGKARMPRKDELPESLQELSFRNATEVRAGHDLQQHLSRLIAGIESLTPSTTPHEYETKRRSVEKSRLQHPGWKRWVYSLLSIILIFVLSIIIGYVGFNFFNSPSYWLLTIITVILVWKRYSRKYKTP